MAAKQVGRVFDFAKLGARVPADKKGELLTLVGAHSQLKESLKKYSAAPAINWAYYQSNISSPQVVEFAKKTFEKLEFPRPEDKGSAKIAQARKEALAKAQAIMEGSAKRSVALGQAMATLNSEKALEDITIKEVVAANPERVAEIDRLVAKEYKWVPN